MVSVERPDQGDRLGPELEQREKVYRLIIVAAVGALVATLVAVVWLVQGKNSTQDELDRAEEDLASYVAGPEAQAAAESILGEIISFDFRDMDDEYDWTKYLADDDLRSDYEDDIAPRFRKVILRTEATADGEIEQSAYNIVDEDTVNVLAFVRQRLTDVDNPDGVIAEQWASLTMTRDGDGWLIENIDIVSVPPPS
jgi:hypothetical protein